MNLQADVLLLYFILNIYLKLHLTLLIISACSYMYSESASICPESAAYLMYAAKKYMLANLVGECRRCLSESLDVDNVVHVLDQCLHLDEQQLQSNCLSLISTNAMIVLTGDKILSASRSVMETVLESNAIPARESVIYETTVNWAIQQLQDATPGEDPTDLLIREFLGDLLYKIRFPVMKPTEFAEISSGNNLLTAEEKESIYYFLVSGKKDRQLKFPTERRIGEEVWIDRAKECATGKRFSEPDFLDAINFTTDQDVLLTGIGLYTASSEKGYNVDMEILQSTKPMFKKSTTVPYTGNSTPYKIVLDEPIVITAGVIYSIKTLPHGRINHYGASCRAVCSRETVTFKFYQHSESIYTTANRGHIPRLYFSFL